MALQWLGKVGLGEGAQEGMEPRTGAITRLTEIFVDADINEGAALQQGQRIVGGHACDALRGPYR